MNQFIKQLKEMKACQPALDWIEERGIDTVQEFWRVSDSCDWMLWLVHEEYPGIDVPIRMIQDIAIEFAEMALPYAGENRQVCIDCIYASWQYLEGWIDIDELIEKRMAATETASAAAWSAIWIHTANAAIWAACAARATANASDIWLEMRKRQADLIRKYIPEV